MGVEEGFEEFVGGVRVTGGVGGGWRKVGEGRIDRG